MNAQKSTKGEREHSARPRGHVAGGLTTGQALEYSTVAHLLVPFPSKRPGRMPDRAGNMPALPDTSVFRP